ncbi:hypothetical protein WN73_12870 [Bradyrhizobium sp. CCBAU 45394]|nr:hypothetical protein [Bradyrhizobium sp. CCBAU 45394]
MHDDCAADGGLLRLERATRRAPQKHLAAFVGILQADCYNGFEPLFAPQKKVLPNTPAFCFAHARRGFFELADIEKNDREGKKGKPVSPIALEAAIRRRGLPAFG